MYLSIDGYKSYSTNYQETKSFRTFANYAERSRIPVPADAPDRNRLPSRTVPSSAQLSRSSSAHIILWFWPSGEPNASEPNGTYCSARFQLRKYYISCVQRWKSVF